MALMPRKLRGKCQSERQLAEKAKSLIEQLSASGEIILRNMQFGKHAGRVVEHAVAHAHHLQVRTFTRIFS